MRQQEVQFRVSLDIGGMSVNNFCVTMHHLGHLHLDFQPVHREGPRRGLQGSVEHYYHFLWGFLLPAVDMLSSNMADAESPVWMRDCGPVMNRLTAEVAVHLGREIRLVPPPLGVRHVTMPRWDLWLIDPLLDEGRREVLRRALDRLRVLLSRWAETTPQSANLPRPGELLVLERSDEPTWYAKGGPAEISKYGRTRRGLLDVGDTVAGLRALGLPASAFEPGAHTLVDQFRAFRDCRGVIAIRGAELANLGWMQPGSLTVIACPVKMEVFPPHRELASITGLHLTEIQVETRWVRLDPQMLVNILHGRFA